MGQVVLCCRHTILCIVYRELNVVGFAYPPLRFYYFENFLFSSTGLCSSCQYHSHCHWYLRQYSSPLFRVTEFLMIAFSRRLGAYLTLSSFCLFFLATIYLFFHALLVTCICNQFLPCMHRIHKLHWNIQIALSVSMDVLCLFAL